MFKGFIQCKLLLLILVFFSINLSAQITAINDSDWSLPSTWDLNRKPISTDRVVINGKTVTLDVSAEVAEIRMINTDGATTALNVKGGGKVLAVKENFSIEASKENFDIDFNIEDTDSVYIGGTLTITRPAVNNNANSTTLKLDNDSRLTINGNLAYEYIGSDGSETIDDIQILGDSKLKVLAGTSFNVQGGNDFSFLINGQAEAYFQNGFSVNMTGGNVAKVKIEGGSNVLFNQSASISNLTGTSGTNLFMYINNGAGTTTINQDLNINSNSANAISGVSINNIGTKYKVAGNINLYAVDEGDVSVDVQAGGSMYLGGNINRSIINDYGTFSMDANARLYLNGSSPQTIPENDKPSNGSDYFNFTNIYLQNSSSSPSTSEGAITITKELILVEGILETASWAPLIIEDDATISGGSSTAYIDGPIVKKGKSIGSNFIFPLGDNGTYAPIEIEQIFNSSVEYTAEYIGCPPPIGLHESPIKSINQSGHWLLSRADGISVGNVTLHWDNASQAGITDTTSLEVAYYEASTGWKSLGRSSATGNAGFIQGHITNNIGCPPPIGIQTFGFASTDEKENILPVELISFEAYTDHDYSKVTLEWETANEENSDFFMVQKSYNGVTYEDIARIPAAVNSSTFQFYTCSDLNPEKGNNYYRIIQIDQDQTMSFSRLINIFINVQAQDQPIIYPNPVKDYLKLYSSAFKNNEEIRMMIFDASGQCIYRKIERVEDGQLFLSTNEVNISNPGIYFISYSHKGAAYSLEIIKPQ